MLWGLNVRNRVITGDCGDQRGSGRKAGQELLWDEMPLVMLYHGYNFSVKSDRLKGYNGFEAGCNNQKVWEWYIEE